MLPFHLSQHNGLGLNSPNAPAKNAESVDHLQIKKNDELVQVNFE
jgi:hypothetical protein